MQGIAAVRKIPQNNERSSTQMQVFKGYQNSIEESLQLGLQK